MTQHRKWRERDLRKASVQGFQQEVTSMPSPHKSTVAGLQDYIRAASAMLPGMLQQFGSRQRRKWKKKVTNRILKCCSCFRQVKQSSPEPAIAALNIRFLFLTCGALQVSLTSANPCLRICMTSRNLPQTSKCLDRSKYYAGITSPRSSCFILGLCGGQESLA